MATVYVTGVTILMVAGWLAAGWACHLYRKERTLNRVLSEMVESLVRKQAEKQPPGAGSRRTMWD